MIAAKMGFVCSDLYCVVRYSLSLSYVLLVYGHDIKFGTDNMMHCYCATQSTTIEPSTITILL